MAYHADRRCQYRRTGEKFSTLEFHEAGRDGKPLCGEPRPTWKEYPLFAQSEGPGLVTCDDCAKKTGH
jgi:hypothetical protein